MSLFSWLWSLIFGGSIKGKKLAILGPVRAGKTTLIGALLNGEIGVGYLPTYRPEKIDGRTIKLEDLDLKVLPFVDVPGGERWHDEWETEFNSADVVCYVCDGSRLLGDDRDYEKRVTKQMRHIGEWFDNRSTKPDRFFIIATHCDKIPEYAALPSVERAEFSDNFWKTPLMQGLVHHGRGIKHVRCITGSLATKEESDYLIGDILRQISK